jgi:hypothetical protein
VRNIDFSLGYWIDGRVRGQERFGLAERHQVAGDSALRAVLGAQVPLEGAEQRAQGGAVHAPKIAQ